MEFKPTRRVVLAVAAVFVCEAFSLPIRAASRWRWRLPHVNRMDDQRVELSWAASGPMNVYQSPDPRAGILQARCLEKGVTENRLIVRSPSDRRLYFILESADGDRVMVAERLQPMEGASNLRDLGGYFTQDGQNVRWGMIFRSGAMPLLTARDLRYLEQLGVRTVIDLRANEERELAPDRLSPAFRYRIQEYSFSAIEDAFEQSRAQPNQPEASLYASFLTLLAPQFRAIFDDLISGQGGLIFHCTAGQDRTGVAAALIFSALGVPRETILEDFHLSTAWRRPANEMPAIDPAAFPHNKMAASAAKSREAPATPLYDGEGKALLEDLFATIEQRWGTVDDYLIDQLGLTRRDLAILRERYLE